MDDSVLAAFLSFLDREMARTPELIQPLSAMLINQARELTKDVEVTDDELLPDDVSL
jgi:antitoxin PrlF